MKRTRDAGIEDDEDEVVELELNNDESDIKSEETSSGAMDRAKRSLADVGSWRGIAKLRETEKVGSAADSDETPAKPEKINYNALMQQALKEAKARREQAEKQRKQEAEEKKKWDATEEKLRQQEERERTREIAEFRKDQEIRWNEEIREFKKECRENDALGRRNRESFNDKRARKAREAQEQKNLIADIEQTRQQWKQDDIDRKNAETERQRQAIQDAKDAQENEKKFQRERIAAEREEDRQIRLAHRPPSIIDADKLQKISLQNSPHVPTMEIAG